MHAFQIGSISEMALWLVLLGQRVEQIRRSAEMSSHENDALRSLALTDALTGLPNRRGLNPMVEGALRRSRPNAVAAVFMLDLDGFKPVNDVHGHAVGDQLLVAVATRLRATVRIADVVARLGGDEFVVVAEGFVGPAAADEFGEELLAAFRDPFALPSGPACSVGATIGYALSPRDGRDAAGVLHLADQAMYEGKQRGKRCLFRHSPARELAAA
jgi:diguanylate cyclase (GGDEF)-like protein